MPGNPDSLSEGLSFQKRRRRILSTSRFPEQTIAEGHELSGAQFAALARAVLNSGASLRFRARGGSMYPTLQQGDILLIRPVSAHWLSKGDIVLCQAGSERLVAHRILGVGSRQKGSRFLVKGDHCGSQDGWVAGTTVLGRVAQVERGQQNISLESKRYRLLGYLIACLSPLNVWQYPAMVWIYRLLRRLGSHHRVLCTGAS